MGGSSEQPTFQRWTKLQTYHYCERKNEWICEWEGKGQGKGRPFSISCLKKLTVKLVWWLDRAQKTCHAKGPCFLRILHLSVEIIVFVSYVFICLAPTRWGEVRSYKGKEGASYILGILYLVFHWAEQPQCLYIYISTREIFASRNLSGAGNERKEVVGRGFPVQLGNRSGFPNW